MRSDTDVGQDLDPSVCALIHPRDAGQTSSFIQGSILSLIHTIMDLHNIAYYFLFLRLWERKSTVLVIIWGVLDWNKVEHFV